MSRFWCPEPYIEQEPIHEDIGDEIEAELENYEEEKE